MSKVYVTVCYPDEHFITTSVNVDSDTSYDTILERVFVEWNAGSGAECELFHRNRRIRSLSVNDVVVVHEDGGNSYFQCTRGGWNRITQQEFHALERAVATHPRRFTDGAWWALNDVMWERERDSKLAAITA